MARQHHFSTLGGISESRKSRILVGSLGRKRTAPRRRTGAALQIFRIGRTGRSGFPMGTLPAPASCSAKPIRPLHAASRTGPARSGHSRRMGGFYGLLFGEADQKSMPPMPPMPPPGMAGADAGFGSSATIASVVMSSEATDAASIRAVRTTLVGSMMPAFTRSV